MIRRIAFATLGMFTVMGCVPSTSRADDAAWSKLASSLDQELGKDYSYIGSIRPRHARDIEASNWSIGAETMDRDFTIYANWKKYLGPLGVKKARIQSGWAKTEKQQGVYEWQWLDEIVNDMVDQGVEPWVCLCYGNPIYPGGGETGLAGGFISSETAMQAWLRYVDAFVQRYQEHVDEWELWNEPRTGRGKGAIQYADFVIRTAEVIRRIQPDAEIMFAAGGSFDTIFATQVLEHLKKQDKLALVSTIVYHPYAENPDSRNDAAIKLREMAQSFAPHIGIRQGENGAPSITGGFGAISGGTWTETRQAKWALRRLLGDLARDIPSSYFSICEMKYPDKINYKGLLAINDDKTIDHVKQGYYAVQNLASVFDNTIVHIKDFDDDVHTENLDTKIELSGYRGPGGSGLITYWRANDKPGEAPEFERVELHVPSLKFESPTLVDLLTGRVYKMPADLWKSTAEGTTFVKLPVYDSPLVVAEHNEIGRSLKSNQ